MGLPAAGIPLSQSYFVSCKYLYNVPQNSFNPDGVPDIGIWHNLSPSMYTNLSERVFPGCGVQTKGNEQFALRTGRKGLVFSFLQAKGILQQLLISKACSKLLIVTCFKPSSSIPYIMSTITCCNLRRVWRYQRGNKNPYIEEEQATQWSKEKRQTTIYKTYT